MFSTFSVAADLVPRGAEPPVLAAVPRPGCMEVRVEAAVDVTGGGEVAAAGGDVFKVVAHLAVGSGYCSYVHMFVMASRLDKHLVAFYLVDLMPSRTGSSLLLFLTCHLNISNFRLKLLKIEVCLNFSFIAASCPDVSCVVGGSGARSPSLSTTRSCNQPLEKMSILHLQ